MLKLDQLYGLVNLGSALTEMELAMKPRPQAMPRLNDVTQQCTKVLNAVRFIANDRLMPLKSCKDSAKRLDKAISDMLSGPNVADNGPKTLNPYFSDPIRQALNDFRVDLANELEKIPVYFTTKKRGYDRDILLNEAEQLLDETDEVPYISDFVKNDIREAGASLMFDRFTASGFHSARAVEGIARIYYTLIKGEWATDNGLESGRDLSLWMLADRLRRSLKAFPKAQRAELIANTLDRMRIIYRNPIMHPEVILKENDAIRLLGLMVDAISHIIADIREGGTHFSALWGIRF